MKTREQSYQEMEQYFLTSRSVMLKNEAPRLIFVFASPGAGKSTNIKPRLNELFVETGAVNLEIDELKTFIPQGEDVDKTADEWFLCLLDKAISQKRNILIFRQRNMLLPGQTLGLYRKAKRAGYVTQASFLALDKERSRLGMVHRYEFALENAIQNRELNRTNYPRYPNFLSHYIFYKAMPMVIRACDLSKAVDIVDVYDRQGKKIAWKDKRSGEQSVFSPLQALSHERGRSWEAWEKLKFIRRRQEAENKMEQHGRSRFERLKFKILTYTSKSK